MNPDYARLAKAVERRRTALNLSIKAAATLAPMSPITWTRVENGQHVRGLTYAGIDRVLRWEPGSASDVLAGGQVTLLPDEQPTPPAGAPASLRYPDDPVLQHLWDTPDPGLGDTERMALVQMYQALKRTSEQSRIATATPLQGRHYGT